MSSSTSGSSSPDSNLIRGHLDLVLLSILVGEPKYGLEISQRAQERTGWKKPGSSGANSGTPRAAAARSRSTP